MAKKRRPGGGRKPTLHKTATFSTRITPETRGWLEMEAKEAGTSISQMAEWLLQDRMKARRARELEAPVRALAVLIENIAQMSKSSTADEKDCEWNTDASVFEVFRLSTAKLLERLRPPGPIDESVEGPLVGQSPELRAEEIVRQIWRGLLSAEPSSPSQIKSMIAEAGGRPRPDRVLEAMSLGSNRTVNLRKDLNIKQGRKEDQ
ncbi:hypothetical protein [Bradyrhizobium sp. URHC0002]